MFPYVDVILLKNLPLEVKIETLSLLAGLAYLLVFKEKLRCQTLIKCVGPFLF
jgi:hypothetical protein